nr:ribonuclease H-like domain-containing protein [Tanacetum cinerariifolium]
MGTFREILSEGTEGALHIGPERPRVYSDFTREEKGRYNADIRATNILLQGFPKDAYTLVNHYTDAKDIWDNVKMLLEDSELTKEGCESQLMQLNSKFVNNMFPEWGRFVTAVKLNRGLRDSNYDKLYDYLKQHENAEMDPDSVKALIAQLVVEATVIELYGNRSALFPFVIANEETIKAFPFFDPSEGSFNLIHKEFRLTTAGVAKRKVNTLRACRQVRERALLLVEVTYEREEVEHGQLQATSPAWLPKGGSHSLERVYKLIKAPGSLQKFHIVPPQINNFRRLPSGCLIQSIAEDLSKVEVPGIWEKLTLMGFGSCMVRELFENVSPNDDSRSTLRKPVTGSEDMKVYVTLYRSREYFEVAGGVVALCLKHSPEFVLETLGDERIHHEEKRQQSIESITFAINQTLERVKEALEKPRPPSPSRASYIVFMSIKHHQPEYFSINGITYQVRVVNGFTSNSSLPLVIWCASQDGDIIGGRALQEGDDLAWDTTLSFWTSNPAFTCTMKWDRTRKKFDAFRVYQDGTKCGNLRKCSWLVKEDGVFRSCEEILIRLVDLVLEAVNCPSGTSVIDSINNLDDGNPLHVQNSDNSNFVIVPFKLLGIENYRIWSSVVKLALQARNKYGFVDGSYLKESYATSDIFFAQWDRCGSSVVDYYHRLNSLWGEFDALTKLPKCISEVKCSCDASKELGLHQQLMKLMQFLMGLDECYQPVRNSLLTKDPLPEVKDAYYVTSREESHRRVHESSYGTESKQNATNFVAKTFNNNKKLFNNNSNNFTKGSSSNVNRGPNPNLNCKHYCKIDHTIDSLSSGFTSKQIQKLHNLINDKSTGSIHANMAANNVMLYDVLVVTGYCVSLLSMNKLIRDIKMFVGFNENKCYIQDLKREKILGTGSEPGGLYFFDVNKSNFIGRNQSDRLTATQIDDQKWFEGNVQNVSQFSPTQNIDDVQTPVLRWSERKSKLPVRFNDYILSSNVKYGIENYVSYSRLSSVNMCFATSLNKSIEPIRLPEALSDPDWVEAMNNETEALNRNNTWTICDLPIGRKPIGGKWMWKIKYKTSGEIKRYKARLVSKGFSQKERFNFDETFSHVVKMVTVRCLISIDVVNKWPLYQLDVNNVFLYGDLVEDVYMTLPDGYNNVDKSKVCKLDKSLYGLKQALRQWNAKLTTALVEHGFEQSKFDYSLYTKHRSGMFIVLLVYVDDIVITGSDIDGINEFKLFLSTKFLIKDLGSFKYFLGIEVINNDLGLCMTQRKYCMELLHEYGLLAAKPIDIPLLENTIINISYDVHCLSQHMYSPLQSHFKAALRVLREKVLAGVIKTVKVSSSLQTADVFTKCLGVVQHKLCCKILATSALTRGGPYLGPPAARATYGRQITDNILITQELLKGYDWKNVAKRVAIKIKVINIVRHGVTA